MTPMRAEPKQKKPMSLQVLAFALAVLILACQPAHACRYHKPINMDHLQYADLIVVGRISDFRIVQPDLEPGLTTAYPRVSFAEFRIIPDEVLHGTAPEQLIVTSYAHAFTSADEVEAGPKLFALRAPTREFPPPEAPGVEALFFPNAVDGRYAILGEACSFPFIFEAESNEADMVRRLVAGEQP